MTGGPDDLAEQAISAALASGGDDRAVCMALVRLAGQALARLASHDAASRLHAQLARRHAERAARSWSTR
ncbi:MAG TPA: hypothetical protein VGI95_15245 [Caulobacteraceae bacterium]|jgi:hypothetical protein